MKERKSGNLKFKVFARVSKERFDKLTALLGKSTCQTMSELVRDILEKREIRVRTFDNSLASVMTELSLLRTELHAIGVNINQVTHRFHLEDSAEGKLFQALEIAKLYQQTDQKVADLFVIISNLSQRWLPGS
jgi:molybdopterin converting factor small subunit